jgi:nucleotide-binding universal stress UspA family protein
VIGWSRVCCAVDLSEPSRIAMLEAAMLASRFETELVLLHVRSRPAGIGADLLVAPRDPRRSDPEVALAAWRDEAERVSGRAVRSVVREGDAAAEIVSFARAWRCDVLVVGTHERKGLGRLVLGSVARKVARGAPCAVLVARRPDAGLAPAERREPQRRPVSPAGRNA